MNDVVIIFRQSGSQCLRGGQAQPRSDWLAKIAIALCGCIAPPSTYHTFRQTTIIFYFSLPNGQPIAWHIDLNTIILLRLVRSHFNLSRNRSAFYRTSN